MNPIKRPRLEQRIADRLTRYPIVALLGARQTGKTRLARAFAGLDAHVFDLENPAQRAALQDNAFTLLDSLRGLIVIDEVQELPSLFPALRVLADRDPLPARFVILGSVAPELIRGIGESLAGRVLTIPMGGFDLDETRSPTGRSSGCGAATRDPILRSRTPSPRCGATSIWLPS
jgi:uncharacterized protein